MTRLGFEPGPPRWKPATNRLSYGAAALVHFVEYGSYEYNAIVTVIRFVGSIYILFNNLFICSNT
jgi:hypothetical protein